jgi:hypothetical protein
MRGVAGELGAYPGPEAAKLQLLTSAEMQKSRVWQFWRMMSQIIRRSTASTAVA